MVLRNLLLVMVLALFGGSFLQAADETAAADEEMLKRAGLTPDGPGVLTFLQRRTLSEEDRRQTDELVRRLGSDQFGLREEAYQKLVALGSPALPFLRKGLKDPDLEIVRRSQRAIQEIEQGPGPALPVAAVRTLVRQRPPEAIQTLLNYIPFADDDWVEEEVLAGLGKLAVQPGKVDPVIAAAIRDSSSIRRAAAAFVLARMGDRDQRAAVRLLLTDGDDKVRHYAARGLLGERYSTLASDLDGSDEKMLMDGKVATDTAGLLAFFRSRTLSEADQQQMTQLIRQLGSDQFALREEAAQKIVSRGESALPFLRPAIRDPDAEVARRAERCLREIEGGPGPALPIAATRVLARRPSPEAIPVLLAFLPFVNDESVEEEVLNVVCFLSVKQGKIDPGLLAALKDPLAARRGGAAFVLGLVGDAEQCQAIGPLLRDPDRKVQFRAAQGMLAAKDRAGVATLLSLLGDAPTEMVWQVEALLQRIAGEQSLAIPTNDGSKEVRQKVQQAWTAWWRENETKLELASLEQGPRHLGLTLIADFDSTMGNGMGKIWECGRDGRPRWEIGGIAGAIDAQVLPNSNVLIAEHNSNRITERDQKGTIRWEQRIPGNPVSVQRLPNGNTFVATYNSVMEYTRDGKQVYSHNPNAGPGFPIYNAKKLRNGHIICMNVQGTIQEIDATGKRLRTLQVGNNNGGWCSVEEVAGGRYLVTMTNVSKVVEVDATGKTVWECSVPSACHATRLPNGNTLVACMNHNRIVEVDRSGKTTVWQQNTSGRPFHVYRR